LKVKVTDLGDCKKQIDVEVPYETIKPGIQKTYDRYQKKVKIDGFRKGRIPLSLLKKQFGDSIEAEIVDNLIQEYFGKAIEQEDLPIIAPGSMKDVKYNENEPFCFTAEVEVEPEVEVNDYTGLKVEKEAVKVSKKEVLQTLEMIRDEKAELVETDKGAQKGWVVTGDVQALDGSGVPLVGQKWEGRSFVIGKAPIGDLLNDQLDGVKKGEERKFTIVQPGVEDGDEELVDNYLITVSKVEEKIIPALDDDFAKSLGEYDSVADLKEKIEARITAQQEEESEKELRYRISEEIIKANDFKIPDAMVQNVMESMYEDHLEQSKVQNQQPAEFQQFKEYQEPQVKWNLKWHLLSDKIVEKENLVVTKDELDKEIAKLTIVEGKEDKKLKTWFGNPKNTKRLQDGMLEDKLMTFLKDNAKIKEVSLKKKKVGNTGEDK